MKSFSSIFILILFFLLHQACKFPECKTESFNIEASSLIQSFYVDQIDDTVEFMFTDSGNTRLEKFLVIENSEIKDNRYQYEDADCECSKNVFNTLTLSYQNLNNSKDTLRMRLIRDNKIASQCEEYYDYTLADRQFDFVITFRSQKIAKISDNTLNAGVFNQEVINGITFDSVYTYPLNFESSNNKQIFIKPGVGLMKIENADFIFERVVN